MIRYHNQGQTAHAEGRVVDGETGPVGRRLHASRGRAKLYYACTLTRAQDKPPCNIFLSFNMFLDSRFSKAFYITYFILFYELFLLLCFRGMSKLVSYYNLVLETRLGGPSMI